jgi:hypothetical protein
LTTFTLLVRALIHVSRMHFHFMMLLVFRPFIDDASLEPSLSPRVILANSATAIIELTWYHKMHWGLGLIHVGMAYIVGLATHVLVTLTRPSKLSLGLGRDATTGDNDAPNADGNQFSGSEVACKGIIILAEIGPYHFIAENLLAALSDLYKWR